MRKLKFIFLLGLLVVFSTYSQDIDSIKFNVQDSKLVQEDAIPELQSPRSTLSRFIKAFDKWDEKSKKQAISCLDLNHINHRVREYQGILLAETLKDIMDHTRKVDLQNVPSSTKAKTWVYENYKSGSISLKKMNNGNWKFSQATLEALNNIQSEVSSRERVVENEIQNYSAAFYLKRWIRGIHPELLSVSFILPNWQWIALLLLIIFGALIHGFTLLYLHKALNRLIFRKFKLSSESSPNIGRPAGIVLTAIFWNFTVRWLGLPPSAEMVLMVTVRFILSLSTVWCLWRLADWMSDGLKTKAETTESKFDDLLVPMVRTALRIFVVAIGLLIIADALDLPLTTILSGLTIGSFAFALAAKDTVENLFGSLTVLLDRPFNIGDWVIIGSTEGSVEKLGFRSTRIRTFYNSVITIPNSTMIKAAVDNMGARSYRRIKTTIGVQYNTSPEQLESFTEGIRKLILEHPYTRKDYYHVYFNQFGASSLDILLYCFVQVPEWGTELRERERLFLDIMRLAKSLNINFAFPTRTLHLFNEQHKEEPMEQRSPEESAEIAAMIASRHSANGEKPKPVVY